jgi:hypothetical protein
MAKVVGETKRIKFIPSLFDRIVEYEQAHNLPSFDAAVQVLVRNHLNQIDKKKQGETLLTVREVARCLGLDNRQIERMCNNGRLYGAVIRDGFFMIPESADPRLAGARKKLDEGWAGVDKAKSPDDTAKEVEANKENFRKANKSYP